MPTATIDGLATRYEVIGPDPKSAPSILMYAPGGFDATLEKWTTAGVYQRTRILDHLSKTYACIVFDRRECGQSGGRVERITWAHYVRHGKALLDHLNIKRAHIMGGCMGVCPATGFGILHPETAISLVLYWPVGGAKWRITGQQRFAQHLGFVQQHGLAEVAALVAREGKPFSADARGGPWASVMRHDKAFADAFARQDVEAYKLTVLGMGKSLFDRDTAPGAEPEDMLRCPVPALVVPGRDVSHATSAARYLEECLPQAQYWDIPPEQQLEANVPGRVLEFLGSHS